MAKMIKSLGQKTIKITAQPPRKQGISPSFVEGDRQSPVKKPKSLTPAAKMMPKKK